MVLFHALAAGALSALLVLPSPDPGDPELARVEAGAARASLRSAALVEGLDWSRNIGFLVLDAEREVFGEHVLLTPDRHVRVEDDYALLGGLLAEARRRLDGWREARTEPLDVLLAIDALLVEWGFEYRDFSSPEYRMLGYDTFSFGLAKRELDCSMYVFVYLAVAEELELPLVGLGLPEHLTLRWNLPGGDSFNWEATVPNRCDDAFYLDWKKPCASSLRKGTYLRALSKAEVLATAFYDKSLVLRERLRSEDARLAAECAVRLAPRDPDVHNLLGLLDAGQADWAEALASYERALDLDPCFANACYNRARCYIALGRLAAAHADLDRLRGLDVGLALQLEALLSG